MFSLVGSILCLNSLLLACLPSTNCRSSHPNIFSSSTLQTHPRVIRLTASRNLSCCCSLFHVWISQVHIPVTKIVLMELWLSPIGLFYTLKEYWGIAGWLLVAEIQNNIPQRDSKVTEEISDFTYTSCFSRTSHLELNLLVAWKNKFLRSAYLLPTIACRLVNLLASYWSSYRN